MADLGIQNWKDKYLQALEDLDASQKQDQQRLDILRRGLVRVSLAADGLDTHLDEQLAELRAALRSSRDITSLEPLVTQLERTVVALDDRRKQEQEELLRLLDSHLEKSLTPTLSRQERNAIKQLRKQLPDLVQSNGTNLEMWRNVQQVQSQLRQSLVARIEELSQHRRGFFSRLFATPQSQPEPGDETPPPSRPARSRESDDELANLDFVNEPEFRRPLRAAAESGGRDEQDYEELVPRLSRILCNLLEQLEVPVEFSNRKDKLVDRIKMEFALDHLPDILDETTQLVASTRMMAQKEFEGFLVALHQRLTDVQDFLDTAKQGEERSLRNQEKLDADVRRELKDIRVSVEGSDDVSRLRQEIEGMVNRIVAAVDSFHVEEKQRRNEVFDHISSLAQRMESMEAEASELKSSLEAQRIEALRDALTELPNRAAYDEQIEREFSRWRRHGRPLSLCVVDIDHFKSINDSLGHLRGDKVLKLVAREISRRVRSEDFVARYGGEEFIIIMPETDQQSALAAAEKVRASVAECPFNFNNERIPVTASFGVSAFQEGDEIETCFERADKALYRAKGQGRNRVEWG